jgi:drug/metabolite transporter (DMT)-like permease
MDWRQFLAPVLGSSAIVFVLFMSDFLSGKTPPFGTHPFIICLILIIGMSMGTAGFDELKRGGHRKVRRNLLVYLIVLLISFLILAFTQIHTHWKILGIDSTDVYWLIPFWLIIVAPFPVALYLNWKQKKSTSEPTSANAS